MGQIVNGPDGCGRNWSKLTVYPGIRQLQPPTEIKGNIWIVHLDLNNREEMSKHIPTHTNGTIWQLSYLGLVQNLLFRCVEKVALVVWKSISTLRFDCNHYVINKTILDMVKGHLYLKKIF